MIRVKTKMALRAVSAGCIILLLALSFLLVACGSRASGTSSPNVSSSTGQQADPAQTPTSSSGNSSSNASGNTSQQIQDAIQAIDSAQQDVNSADATAATENGTNEQP